ncbi:MAG TPA: cytochrome-c oxidase, cbb3-type subunit III [Kiloniellales bacterium]|nr:cytochrome-c oxidase, cbb3-type subunit III [Kiloniellales bacterium]
MARERETDEITGTETTGHEWDGIKELNTPLPRWWLWTFYATVVWAIGYWIVMPAWPLISGYTPGLLGYTNRAAVADRMAEAEAARADVLSQIAELPPEEIAADARLREFAMAGGDSAFAVNCSQCHGQGAAGFPGYPNLNDDAWLWGGTLPDIVQTVRYGIRSDHEETRLGDMPAFLRDGILERDQVEDVVEYVLSLSGRAEDPAAAERGAAVFAEQCAACHMEDATGSTDLGAPNLTDTIWLYGGDRATITETVANGRAGVMPAWIGRLSEATIKQVAIYVHSLGGGQ